LFDKAVDKVILYTWTIDGVNDLAKMLSCAAYTSEARDALEKEGLLESKLCNPSQPYIVATSALRARFDYPHVRMVIHINNPRSIVNFA
jgi:superfamily II DNA helicase RecQ